MARIKLTPKQETMLRDAEKTAWNIRARGQALKTARSLEKRGMLEPFNQDWDVTECQLPPVKAGGLSVSEEALELRG